MASFALALLPPAVYYFASQKPTPVRLMQGQNRRNPQLGPQARGPRYHDPGTEPLQTSNAPNVSRKKCHGYGKAMCVSRFTPLLPKKKSTFQVLESTYNQPLKGKVKRGVTQTSTGPVDDYVSVMPPPTGDYGQAKRSRRMQYLHGNARVAKRKKDASFCAVGKEKPFVVSTGVYQNAQARFLQNQHHNNRFKMDDMKPCNTAIHETLQDRKVKDGHGMARFVPGVPFKNVSTYQHTQNAQAVVAMQMNRNLDYACHNGEVRSNHQGPMEGLVKQTALPTDSQFKGADVEEVYLDRKSQKQVDVLKAIRADQQSSRTSHSETSLQAGRYLDMEVRKGVNTAVASNQTSNTGKRVARFGNLDMTKRNPLYDQKYREGKHRGNRHHLHQTFQPDVAAASNKAINANRNRDSTMQISSRKPAPSLTDAFTGKGYVAGESGVDYNNEQSFDTQTNPLYYKKFRRRIHDSSREGTSESGFANDVKDYAKAGIMYSGPRLPSCD
jgi:hypothetical protein